MTEKARHRHRASHTFEEWVDLAYVVVFMLMAVVEGVVTVELFAPDQNQRWFAVISVALAVVAVVFSLRSLRHYRHTRRRDG